MHKLLSKAVIPDGKTPVEAEAGLNVCLYQLKNNISDDKQILFGNVTAGRLRKALESGANFIDFTKFELGEDWGK